MKPRSAVSRRVMVAVAAAATSVSAMALIMLPDDPLETPWSWSFQSTAELPLTLDLRDPAEANRWYRGPGVRESVADSGGLVLQGEGDDFHISRSLGLPAHSLGSVEIVTSEPVAGMRVSLYIKGVTDPGWSALARPSAERPELQVARFRRGRWDWHEVEGIRLQPDSDTTAFELVSLSISRQTWPPVSELAVDEIDWSTAFRTPRPAGARGRRGSSQAGWGGASEAATGKVRNALLIVIDTLRADHLSLYGYARPTTPQLERLAAYGTVFEAARSQAACTFPSVNSLLTSRPPAEFLRRPIEKFGRLDDYPSIAKILRAGGFETLAVSASGIVRATSSHVNNWGGGYSEGFDVFNEECLDRSAACVNLKGIEAIDASDGPWFLYLHYIDPHNPYSPPPSYRRQFQHAYDGRKHYRRGDPDPIAQAIYRDKVPHEASERDIEELMGLYDDEIRYLDGQLALLFAALHERGLLSETVIVLAADHGEEFLEHGHMKHCRTVFEGETRTPLIWWIPGVANQSTRATKAAGGGIGRSRRVAQNLDIVPTLVDYLKIANPEAGFAGRSLRPAIESDLEVNRFAFSDQGELQSANDGRYKLIRDRKRGAVQLFDLRADPGELRDRASELGDITEKLRHALDGWNETPGRGAVEGASEMQERLRAIGYLE